MDSKKKHGRSLIFSGEDKYGPVEVAENASRRTLYFGTTGKQSEIYKNMPYAPCLEYIKAMLCGLAFTPEPKAAYFMGLGGGTLPSVVYRHYPGCRIVVSEIRPLVHQVARRFFGFPKAPEVEVRIEDGCESAALRRERYDLLFIDAYDSDGLSPRLDGRRLHDLLQPAVARESVIIINLWRLDRSQIRQLELFEKNDCALLRLSMRQSGNIIFYLMSSSVLAKAQQTMGALVKPGGSSLILSLKELLRNIERENSVKLI